MAKITVSVDLPNALPGIFARPWLGSAPFVLALLSFFLVFTEFHCGDKKMTEARGYQLVTGDSIIADNPFVETLNEIDRKLGEHTTLKPVKQWIPPQPWAIAAAVLLVIAAIAVWVRVRWAGLVAGGAGFVATICLAVLRFQMVKAVEQEYEMIKVTFTFGFYLALSMALAGAILAFVQHFSPPDAKNHAQTHEPNTDFGV